MANENCLHHLNTELIGAYRTIASAVAPLATGRYVLFIDGQCIEDSGPMDKNICPISTKHTHLEVPTPDYVSL